MNDAHLFKTGNAASYWMAVIGRTERMPDVGEKLIAEMDNPPEAFNTLEQEALKAENEALKAENEALRAEVERDKALLWQALEALEGLERWASSIFDGYPPSTAGTAAEPYRKAARAAIAALRVRQAAR